MATWLGALVALSEEPSLIPNTHTVAHNHLKLQTMTPTLSSGLREPQRHGAQIYTQAKTHI